MSAGWGSSATAPPAGKRTPELSASRRLLRRIMELAAAPIQPQQRLDRIVSLIAADMVAEVCSIYVRRSGNILELFATQGLRRDAVHQTRMRLGEGLVGHIAERCELINTNDAQHHPLFQYFPETGEEIYRSFLGVPILRGGEVAGVVVAQNTWRGPTPRTRSKRSRSLPPSSARCWRRAGWWTPTSTATSPSLRRRRGGSSAAPSSRG